MNLWEYTMELKNIEERLAALPENNRREVAELVSALEERQRLRDTAMNPALSIVEQAFVGMWKDRDDMADSTGWVRRTRLHEWREPNA